ncbi:HIT family hydrolase [Betaproteobacteria bacterium SCGC AG-212-J23]|nr:HIT family hydrolase [Betaproteobacteria bacterium SCGC AG-212-J23]
MSCELCDADGGKIVWRDDFCRVVRPAVEGYPGFLRVIVNRHVKEMTDLGERDRLMQVVFACESALRGLYKPDKINLASLGNVVPHVHWHVIARFVDDAHFPDPIWAPVRRAATPRPAVTDEALMRAIMAAL